MSVKHAENENILGSPTRHDPQEEVHQEIRMQEMQSVAARFSIEEEDTGKDSGNESQIDSDTELEEKQDDLARFYVGMNVSFF